MYALNLSDDGRILSATFEEFASETATIVEALPDGDIYEYRYVNGEFVHEPLPVEGIPVLPTYEERITTLEAENAMLMECLLEMSEIVYA